MELLRTRKINKEILSYKISPLIDKVTMTITKENGKIKQIDIKGEGPHKSYPTFVKPEFWELIKKDNPWSSVKGNYMWNGLVYSNEEVSKLEAIKKSNIVWVYNAGYVIFDYNENVVPIPYLFDYIGTPFDSSVSKLEPMLEHLKKHKWVLNRDELHIQNVPYYNNDSGTRKFIAGNSGYIHILPDKKSINEIYQKCKNDQYFSLRMKDMVLSRIPDGKDYLGIRSFEKIPQTED